MECFDCGNCRQEEATYYCTAQNRFIIKEQQVVIERDKSVPSNWKKGGPDYELRRRKVRQERGDIKKIG